MARRRRWRRSGKLGPESSIPIIGILVLYRILSDPQLLLTLLLLLLVVGVASFLQLLFKEHTRLNKIRRSGIEEIDQMEGTEFEERVWLAFMDLGWNASKTPTTGDFGADIILTRGNDKIAVQVKRYQKPVGVKAVQEAHTAKAYYSCNKAMVVTNSTFTPNAIELATQCSVELWDREKLISVLNQQKIPSGVVEPLLEDNSFSDSIDCSNHLRPPNITGHRGG